MFIFTLINQQSWKRFLLPYCRLRIGDAFHVTFQWLWFHVTIYGPQLVRMMKRHMQLESQQGTEGESRADSNACEQDYSLGSVDARLLNAVYAACQVIEICEYKGLVRGNGHHARQKIAEFASHELRRRWIADDDTVVPVSQTPACAD